MQMTKKRSAITLTSALLLALAAAHAIPDADRSGTSPSKGAGGNGGGDEEDMLVAFDFSDAFYLENGILPDQILGRTGTKGAFFPWVPDHTDSPNHRGARNIMTLPGLDHSGHPMFFHVHGEYTESAFTPDERGAEAREISEQYPLYLFPAEGVDPLTQSLPFPIRQNDVVPLNNGYFSNNPLGLWVLVFPMYTEEAYDQMDTHELLIELAEENGRALTAIRS